MNAEQMIAIALASLLPLSLLALAWLTLRQRRALAVQAEELTELRRELDVLRSDLAGMCRASRGAGDHLLRLEARVHRLTERQNQSELRTASDRPYTQAIELVRQGAAVEDLIQRCGLTRGEAELIQMLHGLAEAG